MLTREQMLSGTPFRMRDGGSICGLFGGSLNHLEQSAGQPKADQLRIL
jgi:hypothetical protein